LNISCPWRIAIRQGQVQAKIAHADETGLRITAKLYWLHVVCTTKLTWYGIHPKGGRQAIKHFGILTRFTGRLMRKTRNKVLPNRGVKSNIKKPIGRVGPDWRDLTHSSEGSVLCSNS